MHPLRPLQIEVAWVDESGKHWDSQGGANYHYEFQHGVRGLGLVPQGGRQFQSARRSRRAALPESVVELLRIRRSRESGGRSSRGQFDARPQGSRRAVEGFCSLDYMDLHILKNNCGIGLHATRHHGRYFSCSTVRQVMVTGDWCKSPQRERCFEVRTLQAGHFSLLKPGGCTRSMNATDADITLLMFGGYD